MSVSAEIGTLGVRVADQIRERRQKWGMGYNELSRRLTEYGRPIPPLGLRRIESYKRRIDIDDGAALAAVLELPGIAIINLPDSPELSDRWHAFVRLNPTNARDWAIQILAAAAQEEQP